MEQHEIKNHFQIVDEVKAGTSYTFPGAVSGRPFVMTYENGFYIVKPGTREHQALRKSPKPMRLNYEKALAMVLRSLTEKPTQAIFDAQNQPL